MIYEVWASGPAGEMAKNFDLSETDRYLVSRKLDELRREGKIDDFAIDPHLPEVYAEGYDGVIRAVSDYCVEDDEDE